MLLEDFPGLGKTLAARAFAAGTGPGLPARSQFTPDLLPADLTGSFIYDQRRRGGFSFRPGAAVRTGAAGRRDQPHAAEDPGRAARGDAGAAGDRRGRDLPRSLRPSTSSRTPDPVETEGTYPLPEAQLDRFLLRVELPRYPAAERGVGGAAGGGWRGGQVVVRPSGPGRSTRRACWASSRRGRVGARSTPTWAATAWRWRRRPASPPPHPGRLVAARRAWPCCWSPGRLRGDRRPRRRDAGGREGGRRAGPRAPGSRSAPSCG